MKFTLWLLTVLLVVPLQVTVLQYAGIGGVRPDVCLALTCLVGFRRSEYEGLLLGALLGFAQDLVSTGQLWLNLLTKAGAGLMAGLIGRQLVQPTALSFLLLMLTSSALSGMLFLFVGRPLGSWEEEVVMFRAMLLPQAAYDAAVGAVLYWLLGSRVAGDRKSALVDPSDSSHSLAAR